MYVCIRRDQRRTILRIHKFLEWIINRVDYRINDGLKMYNHKDS